MQPAIRRRLSLRLSGFLVLLLFGSVLAIAADPWDDKFRQLEEILPTPNAYRTASGAPGHGYWQQRADYEIELELDDELRRITARETITYTNHSPDSLTYLWLQLEQNLFRAESAAARTAEAPDFEEFPYNTLRELLTLEAFDGGFHITAIEDEAGSALPHTVVDTMLRIDLPAPLGSGETLRFSVAWWFNIPDATIFDSRGGYELFEEDGNAIYEIAQWFPRVVSYNDVTGWQHKQFLGSGEFTLELGNYRVRITVPGDHVVAATGELRNPEEVLSEKQRRRLAEARAAAEPVFIVTPKEARRAEKGRSRDKKTWIFEAEQVRDFAFASSRKFIWDAMGHRMGDQHVMAMSLYPNEAEPLWSRYSTHAIVHTLDVYSRYTFPYPYPVAISVNGPVGGMEYPMICFNGPRPEPDGTYWGEVVEDEVWERSKYALISVIIHEVGHNYFPMIVNSDERQWTWMDEGLNSFLQFLAEQEWEEGYPSRRGEPERIVEYMSGDTAVPIMTNSESILQLGNNAYGKPATALNILRETVLGRELFDFAFREYARRWRFKRPMPADFFRTMEDASGIDLDWFWRGWFYSTDTTDLGIAALHLYTLETRDPEIDKPLRRAERDAEPPTLSQQRNAELPKRVDLYPELKDFYNTFDDLDITAQDKQAFFELLLELEDHEADLLRTERFFYVLDLESHGGLVMPVILLITYADGSEEELRIPAEIWRRHPKKVSKLLLSRQEITSIVLDPHLETADTDRSNNYYPTRPIKSRFQLFKETLEKNPMQKAREAEGGF